jgi:hypothetical protein
MRYILFSLMALSLYGCLYKMPDADHIATSPLVNNPDYTREKPPSFPGRS